jgi:hypothetical protein
MAVPSWVSVAPAGFSCAATIAFAMPKSATTAVRPESRMLSGLMSRWTTPRSCAYDSAFATSRRMSTACEIGTGPAARRARRLSPSTNGMV